MGGCETERGSSAQMGSTGAGDWRQLRQRQRQRGSWRKSMRLDGGCPTGNALTHALLILGSSSSRCATRHHGPQPIQADWAMRSRCAEGDASCPGA